MKSIPNHITVLTIYLVSMNMYFCLWYLASDGEALEWSSKEGIGFYHIWISTNLATVLSFVLFDKLTGLVRDCSKTGARVFKIRFLLKCLANSIFFIAAFIIINSSFKDFISLSNTLNYIKSASFLSLALYHFTFSIVLVALLNLIQRFGGVYNVFRYSFGKKLTPKEVQRGFMFLDLDDSTGIAERLDSESYSAFLRDCFQALDEIVEAKPGVDIYQYVGDEVILHWDYQNKRLCAETIDIFQTFKKILRERHQYFYGKYQIIPSFKSAIHGGVVIQTELGKNMAHTAFHGDVVNATSRILGLCHKHQTDLLISEQYFRRLLSAPGKQEYECINDVVINGKIHRLTVYKPITVRRSIKPVNKNELYLTKKYFTVNN